MKIERDWRTAPAMYVWWLTIMISIHGGDGLMPALQIPIVEQYAAYWAQYSREKGDQASDPSAWCGVVIKNVVGIAPILLARWLTSSRFEGTVEHRKLIVSRAIKPSQAPCLKETSP